MVLQVKLTPAAQDFLSRFKRPLAWIAAAVGVVSGLIGIYQWAVPVPVTISSEDLKAALNGRSPCEVVASRGLPCSVEGLAQAASSSKETIDLLFAAGINGNMAHAEQGHRPQPLWRWAYDNNLTYAQYIIDKTVAADHNLKVFEIPHYASCEARDFSYMIMNPRTDMFEYHECSATEIVKFEKDEELFCKVYLNDQKHDEIRARLGPSPDLNTFRRDWVFDDGAPFPFERMKKCDQERS